MPLLSEAPFFLIACTVLHKSHNINILQCLWAIIGIDGYSRLVTYLHCSDNNLASTVLQCFTGAVSQYGYPSRVRCDLSVENVDIARVVIGHRGTGRGSIITGSSTHNQRIERLWRDVRRVVIRQYQNLFNHMERYGFLDPLNDMHLLALHHVFIPRVNRALNEFQHQYNNHSLRTEHNMTPLQLFSTGPCTVSPISVDPASYGIEDEGPVPDIEAPDNAVVVPSIRYFLTVQQLQLLPDSLLNDANYGIHFYTNTLVFSFPIPCII